MLGVMGRPSGRGRVGPGARAWEPRALTRRGGAVCGPAPDRLSQQGRRHPDGGGAQGHRRGSRGSPSTRSARTPTGTHPRLPRNPHKVAPRSGGARCFQPMFRGDRRVSVLLGNPTHAPQLASGGAAPKPVLPAAAAGGQRAGAQRGAGGALVRGLGGAVRWGGGEVAVPPL